MVQTSTGCTVDPCSPSFASMCPPSKPRRTAHATARAGEPEGNLAVQLPDEQSPPSSDVVLDEPVPEPTDVEATASEEHDEEPVAGGVLRYHDASAQQQEVARAVLQDRIAAYLKAARARVIITDNLATMLSIKRGKGGVFTFRLHHMFIRAPAMVIRAVARYAETHDRDAAKLLHAYTDENEALIRQRVEPRAITIDTQGRYHNLQDIFDELNEQYFEGQVEARITWGKRSKRRRSRNSIELGKYVFDDKLIRIHPVLDAEDVPRYFVASVVFHEMLHEVHGPASVDGRREYHPPEFHRDEERFEHYVEAVMWERTHASKLLDR